MWQELKYWQGNNMIEWLTAIILMYGIKSLIISKIIEAVGTVLPTSLRRYFLWLLRYEIIRLGKIAIPGVPLIITGEMILGFIIGHALFGF